MSQNFKIGLFLCQKTGRFHCLFTNVNMNTFLIAYSFGYLMIQDRLQGKREWNKYNS